MNKDEFVAKLAEQLEIKRGAAEAVVNASLAELVAPKIFSTDIVDPTGILAHNNCNNNCKEELARISPTRSIG